MESRKMNVMINKAGGKASAGTLNYRISIPNIWAQGLNITKENRSVVMTYDSDKKEIRICPVLNEELSFVVDTLELQNKEEIILGFK